METTEQPTMTFEQREEYFDKITQPGFKVTTDLTSASGDSAIMQKLLAEAGPSDTSIYNTTKPTQSNREVPWYRKKSEDAD